MCKLFFSLEAKMGLPANAYPQVEKGQYVSAVHSASGSFRVSLVLKGL
jgi:hypothetical protein